MRGDHGIFRLQVAVDYRHAVQKSYSAAQLSGQVPGSLLQGRWLRLADVLFKQVLSQVDPSVIKGEVQHGAGLVLVGKKGALEANNVGVRQSLQDAYLSQCLFGRALALAIHRHSFDSAHARLGRRLEYTPVRTFSQLWTQRVDAGYSFRLDCIMLHPRGRAAVPQPLALARLPSKAKIKPQSSRVRDFLGLGTLEIDLVDFDGTNQTNQRYKSERF